MPKKAQLAILLIVGIVILLVVLSANELTKRSNEKLPQSSALLDSPSSEINRYIESCVKQIGEEAVYDVLFQSGYFHVPATSTQLYNVKIAHYWEKDKSLMPSLMDIEEQLGLYIDENIDTCFNDFSDFKQKGYAIQKKESHKTTVDISDAVLLTFDSKLTLQRSSSSFAVEPVQATLDFDLLKAYYLAVLIMLEQEKDPDYVPLGFITDLAKKNDFTFELLHYNNEVIVSLIFPVSEREDLIYSFVQVYDEASYLNDSAMIGELA